MTDRTDRVWLPNTEPRCAPAECHCRMRCARTMSDIPTGTPLQDYSSQPLGGTVLCPGFVSLTSARQMRADAAAKPREVKTWPK